MSDTADRPTLDSAKFSASIIKTPGLPHNLTVKGEAVGDYRVEGVKLIRPDYQGAANVLVLDVTATLGPVKNPHPLFEKVWPLDYSEAPARQDYTEVEIVNGSQKFTVPVIDAL